MLKKMDESIMNNWIDVNEKLPQDGQRCIIYDKYSNSFDSDVKTRIYCANFYKGEFKPNGPWSFCDTGFGNNQFPWAWQDGPASWFSQDISYWMPVPNDPEK